MVMTVSVPYSDRAATPAARRISRRATCRGPCPVRRPTRWPPAATARPPGDLLGAALGAERLERDLDLADGLGVEERVGDDGRACVVVLAADHGHDQHRVVDLALGQRRADGDGGGLMTGFCWAHERSTLLSAAHVQIVGRHRRIETLECQRFLWNRGPIGQLVAYGGGRQDLPRAAAPTRRAARLTDCRNSRRRWQAPRRSRGRRGPAGRLPAPPGVRRGQPPPSPAVPASNSPTSPRRR